MSRLSQYARPARAAPLRLQPRDLAVVATVGEYRYLTSDHIARLVFANVARRTALQRLRRLWEAGHVERLFVPGFAAGASRRRSGAIYTVARRRRRMSFTTAPPARHKIATPQSVLHDLIANDFLVAVELASRGRPELQTVIQPEWLLRRRAGTANEWERAQGKGIVPDGAVTLGAGRGRRTFYLEIVRAGVRSGNKALKAKLARYAELQREQYFRRVFGHERIRAVLIATTSPDRARLFRELAGGLKYGRQLFWFVAYRNPADHVRSCFNESSIFDAVWQGIDRNNYSILSDHSPATNST